MKIVIKRSKNRQFTYCLVSSNGKILMSSETVKRKPLKQSKRLAAKLGAPVVDLT
jgi:uncharacterized protein YegP (UPF0339 family)